MVSINTHASAVNFYWYKTMIRKKINVNPVIHKNAELIQWRKIFKSHFSLKSIWRPTSKYLLFKKTNVFQFDYVALKFSNAVYFELLENSLLSQEKVNENNNSVCIFDIKIVKFIQWNLYSQDYLYN